MKKEVRKISVEVTIPRLSKNEAEGFPKQQSYHILKNGRHGATVCFYKIQIPPN